MGRGKYHELASKHMPDVPVRVVQDAYRHNVIDALTGQDNIGIELGVAKGIFSARMVESGKFRLFFGVDVYGDSHDTEEYKEALRRIGLLGPYKLLRMTFDDALDLFDDHFFDFIYIDGFAHSGEEGGETLAKWYRKLKVGGILAGDDYHDDWPLVKWAVNHFVSQIGAELSVTGQRETLAYCKYPSWFITKQAELDKEIDIPEPLARLGKRERDRIQARRMARRSAWRRLLRAIFSRQREES